MSEPKQVTAELVVHVTYPDHRTEDVKLYAEWLGDTAMLVCPDDCDASVILSLDAAPPPGPLQTENGEQK